MPNSSRDKGLKFERDVVKKLKGLFPNAERAIVGSSLDNSGIDIRGSGRLLIQCKRFKKYVNPGKIEEIKRTDGIRVLCTREDKKAAIVCLYLDDFINILEDIGVVYEN